MNPGWKCHLGQPLRGYLYEIDGGKPIAFAGLWEQWWGPDHKAEKPLESCTIITTDANELARKVHDRMPVILDESVYDAWLDVEFEDAGKLLTQFPAKRMKARPVSTYVSNARNQGPECVAPVAE